MTARFIWMPRLLLPDQVDTFQAVPAYLVARPVVVDAVAPGSPPTLVRDPAVARRWHEESACAGMSVGGLAAHLAGQARTAVRLLSAPPNDAEAIPVQEHYRRAAWVHTGLARGCASWADDEAEHRTYPAGRR